MKKISFIDKLIEEKKISLVESSVDISRSYFLKSENALKAAKILLPEELLEESTSMIYYSMYNKLLSLLFRVGIKCENHSGSIILLKELFDIPNDLISFAKRERVDKQYYTDFVITQSEVRSLFDSAVEFLAQLEFYINKLGNKEIKTLRTNFSETYLI